MATGWKYLEPKDEDKDLYGPESDDGKYWFYFSASGKKNSRRRAVTAAIIR